ncbi:MAG: S41 family peptidase [bacterium]
MTYRKKIAMGLLMGGLMSVPFVASEESEDDFGVQDEKVAKPGSEYEPEKDIYKWFQSFAEVVGLVEKKAFRAVDFSKFIQDSLKSAVAQVDAHSAFFTPKSYKAALESTKGEFSGIGVSVITKSPEDEALVIVDVIQDGPAFKVGLESGDKIVEIQSEKLKGLSSDEVINLLKGKSGSKVKIKVIRDKKPLEFTVVRDIIKDQTSICYLFENQKVYYVSLKIFNEVSATQVKDILNEANKGNCKGIVLDLRRNPGGTLDAAIEMAGLFLKKDSLVVSTRDKDGRLIAQYKTSTDPILKSDVPIFILIDNFTASASEILAGCLRHHSEQNTNEKLKVFLLGTETFGKGSVQELIPIKNGCALKLTTMLYYLPVNDLIQAVGIKPDFTIRPKMTPDKEMKWVEELYGKESSLKNHITVDEVKKQVKGKERKQRSFWGRLWGKDKKKKDKKQDDDVKDKRSWEQKQIEALGSDVQVQASVNLITLLNLARKSNVKDVETWAGSVKFLCNNYMTDDAVKIVKIR